MEACAISLTETTEDILIQPADTKAKKLLIYLYCIYSIAATVACLQLDLHMHYAATLDLRTVSSVRVG